MTRTIKSQYRYSWYLNARRSGRYGVWDNKRSRRVHEFRGPGADEHAHALADALNRRSRRWGWFSSLFGGGR